MKPTLYAERVSSAAVSLTQSRILWNTSICSSLSESSKGIQSFRNTALEAVTVPASVEKIGTEAFGYCLDLESFCVLNPFCQLAADCFDNGFGTDDQPDLYVQTKLFGHVSSTLQTYARTMNASMQFDGIFVMHDTGSSTETAFSVGPESAYYVLPECKFTAPVGRHFAGWAVKGQLYQPGAVLEVTEDTACSAVFDGVFGDIDGDGSAAVVDAVVLVQAMSETTAVNAEYADLNGDGVVSLPDVQLLLTALAQEG